METYEKIFISEKDHAALFAILRSALSMNIVSVRNFISIYDVVRSNIIFKDLVGHACSKR